MISVAVVALVVWVVDVVVLTGGGEHVFVDVAAVAVVAGVADVAVDAVGVVAAVYGHCSCRC